MASVPARRGLLGLLLFVLTSGAAPASAAEQPVRLAIAPVDQESTFFDLTVTPGQTLELAVDLSNRGGTTIDARTYAADAYTIVNGGFGARMRDDPTTGTTRWLNYPSGVLQLDPGQAVRRTFRLTVPRTAEPGEYITSIAIENAEPLRGTGDVALDQIVRQVVAVALTIPGPAAPGLEIRAARHSVAGTSSVIGVDVANTGALHLRPSGKLVLSDDAGRELSRAAVAMGSFYAHTSTLVEVPLATLLVPGRYRVALTLEDAEHDVVVRADALPLDVAAAAAPERPGAETGLTDVVQDVGDVPVWLLVIAGIAILALGMGLAAAIGSVRRRRTHTTASAAGNTPSSTSDA